MKKFTFSLLIAIVLHIIVLLLSGLIIGDKQSTFFEYQNAIPVQFGSGTKNPGGSAPKIQKTIPARTGNRIEQTTNDVPLSSGAGTGVGNIEGKGQETNPGTSFETSIINYQGPVYPRVAQVRGLQGSVRIRIKVSTEGLAEDTVVLKSSGHEVLDKAALAVIPQWRFQKSSSPYFVEKNIVFELKN